MPKHPSPLVLAAGLMVTLWIAPGPAAAADWPTYGGDNRRSGLSDQRLVPPLKPAWVHRAPAPRPAWPQPARHDLFHKLYRLTPSLTFDRALHPVVADGSVYFGSSADDKITCLDAATGRVRWTFFTEGPVRLAPSVAGGKVYAGSDDGQVYCLSAGDGKLLWKYRAGPEDRRIGGNGRMISPWPVRCGVLVEASTAWFCAGLFPTYGVYLCAVDAADGTERWKRKLTGVSPQGYILGSDTRLYVPSGRTSPAVFDCRDGKPLGTLHGNRRGGSYALLVDDLLVYRGEGEGSLAISDHRAKERLVIFPGLQMVVHRETAYLHTGSQLAALNRVKYLELARLRNKAAARKDKAAVQKLTLEMDTCWVWKRPSTYAHSLILAGDVLFAGGNSEVAAVAAADGELIWKAAVIGNAYGLAAAGGRLFVSTDEGAIHCFQ